MQNRNSLIQIPLSVKEVMTCLRDRWGVSYDLKLVIRRDRLYLHMMWGYLEQQSFPLDEEGYKSHLNNVLEIINRLGLSEFVREWLKSVPSKPRLGRALILFLPAEQGLDEFIL